MTYRLVAEFTCSYPAIIAGGNFKKKEGQGVTMNVGKTGPETRGRWAQPFLTGSHDASSLLPRPLAHFYMSVNRPFENLRLGGEFPNEPLSYCLRRNTIRADVCTQHTSGQYSVPRIYEDSVVISIFVLT
jgi:hypothetical protein